MAKPATWTDLHEAARKALLNRAYEEAEGLLLQCCQEAEADGGTDHKEIAQILEQLAEAQWYQSKLRESEQTCERLLETAKAMRDPVVRVVCLSNLAIVNHTLNNWKEAEEFYLETLKEIRILLGPDHSYVTKYRSFYAEMLNQQNRQEEAKALGVQPREVTEFDWQTSKVVSMIQERLGNPGLSATALSSLVAVEMTREEYEMVYRSNSLRAKQAVSEGDLLLSEKLWAFNLKLIEKFKEPDEKLITALDNIAGMQYQQGRLKQSLVTFEKALTLKRSAWAKKTSPWREPCIFWPVSITNSTTQRNRFRICGQASRSTRRCWVKIMPPLPVRCIIWAPSTMSSTSTNMQKKPIKRRLILRCAALVRITKRLCDLPKAMPNCWLKPAGQKKRNVLTLP